MCNTPTFAVVIPMYNKEVFIERALNSVLMQTINPAEVIVVDDGSTDRSLEVAEDICSRMSNSRIVRQANMGVSSARNVGADSATADFVAFLDADDEWLPEHLELLRKLAIDFPNAEVLSTKHCRALRGKVIEQVVALPLEFRGEVEDFIETYRRGFGIIHSSTVAIRRDVFCMCGGFAKDARRSQDIHLWLRLGLSKRIVFDGRTTVIRHDDGSAARSRSAIMPYHLERFLDPDNEISYWNNPQLKRFLRKSLTVFLMTAVQQEQTSLIRRLLEKSRMIGGIFFIFALTLAMVPRQLLGFGRRAQLFRRRIN